MNTDTICCLGWGILVAAAIFAGKRQYYTTGTRLCQRFSHGFAVAMLVALTVALATVQTVFAQEDFLEEAIGAMLMAGLCGGGALVAFDAISKNCRTELQEESELRASIARTRGIPFTGRTYAEPAEPELAEQTSLGVLGTNILSQTQEIYLRQALEQEVALRQRLDSVAHPPKFPVFTKKPGDCPENYADLLPQRWPLIMQYAQFKSRVEACEMPQVAWLPRQAKSGL